MLQRLTLLVAPAGYGKTALLAEWLSQISSNNIRVGFVALDTSDNDPNRFWLYVVAAVKKAFPKLRFKVSNDLGDSSLDLHSLAPLLNEIAESSQQVCLVLDAFEVLNNRVVHEQINHFIGNMPENMHVYISSRVMPPFGCFGQLAHGQVMQITEAGLSFDLEETEIFLSRIMNLRLSADEIGALWKMTEGWVTGLRLAAQSLRNQRSFGLLYKNSRDGFPQSLKRLADDLLSFQRPDVREFLLKTSILEKLSAPVCDAILQSQRSREIISLIEQANLFVIPLDSQRRWFRYHPLFLEALRVSLEEEYPDSIKELHNRAFRWYRDNGAVVAAIHHAIACDDLESAAQLASTHITTTLLVGGPLTLIKWIEQFSPELIRQYPGLGIACAQAAFSLGQPGRSEAVFNMLESRRASLGDAGKPYQSFDTLQWQIDAIRAAFDCVGENYRDGLRKIEVLLANVPVDEATAELRGFLNHFRGYAYTLRGDLDSAAKAFDKACECIRRPCFAAEYVISRCEFARIRRAQARLRDSERAYRDALDYATLFRLDELMTFLAQCGLAEIHSERNELDSAERLMRNGLNYFALIEPDSLLWCCSVNICVRIASYYLARKDLDKARFYYGRARRTLREWRHISYSLFPEMTSLQLRMWLAEGDMESAIQWEKHKRTLHIEKNSLSLPIYIGVCRVNLAAAHPSAALKLLAKLEPELRVSERKEWTVEAKILKALALWAKNATSAALKCLNEVIELTEPENWVRPFLEQGSAMRHLFLKYLESADSSDCRFEVVRHRSYVARVLDAMNTDQSNHTTSSRSPGIVEVFRTLEPLSKRELDVLKVIAKGGSAKDVAISLDVSVNTAKTHIRNVYRKLEVHTQSEASQRAKLIEASF